MTLWSKRVNRYLRMSVQRFLPALCVSRWWLLVRGAFALLLVFVFFPAHIENYSHQPILYTGRDRITVTNQYQYKSS